MVRFISRRIIRHRKLIVVFAVVLALLCAVAMLRVRVNYDLSSYLPEDSPGARAMAMLKEGTPNLRLYIPDLPFREAPLVKQKLASLPYILGVLWLDDSFDPTGLPMEMIPEGTLSPWYKDGGALFRLTVDEDHYAQGVGGVRAAYPDAIADGNAANQAQVISVTTREIARIIPFVLPIVLVILLVSTRHWIDPALFLVTIGIAILINEGSNIFLGGISFITRAAAAVLQLAVSIDYAVFLLHRFEEYRDKGLNNEAAMLEAMVKSSSAIAASALTTVFGFLVLVLMRFSLGRDMGLVMAKGVLISYLCVIILLPALILGLTKTMDRTLHRPLMPTFRRTSRLIVRFGGLLLVVFVLLLPLSYLGQRHNTYLFGSGGMHAEGSRVKEEARQIAEKFGADQEMLLLLPEGHPDKVKALGDELRALPEVTAVVSYATMVGNDVPAALVPESSLAQLKSGGYDRLILTAAVKEEGDAAFQLVSAVRAAAEGYYGDSYYFLGEPVINDEIRTVITEDADRVLVGGLVSIGLVLLFTFRSLSVPLVLLFTIEGAIWVNMALPYFQGASLNYIGYQIVSSVQLGATIDYAILLTQRYLERRRTADKRAAAEGALEQPSGAGLPPAAILTVAGAMLGLVSTNGVISQMGLILGRGAALSLLTVVLVLPQLLKLCDGLIQKTTMQPKGNQDDA